MVKMSLINSVESEDEDEVELDKRVAEGYNWAIHGLASSPTSSPSSMPPFLPTSSSDVYSDLITLLSPSPPQILELDILPSSYPPKIHSSPPSVAIPKPLLASLFLTARHVFFSYLTSQRVIHDSDKGQGQGHASESGSSGSDPISYAAAFESTLILLLWDPNHLTAANFRKKHLLSLRNGSGSHKLHTDPSFSSSFAKCLTIELAFLTTLLTSPLPKHTKSPTLWSHRLFLLRTFGGELLPLVPIPSNDRSACAQHLPTALWEQELAIILKAAERHPRNYYSWNYARQLLYVLSIASSAETGESEGESGAAVRKCLAGRSVIVVQKWCLGHPRDISGWAFLEHTLRTLIVQEEAGTCGPTKAKAKEEKQDAKAAELVNQVMQETRHFKMRFSWKGASVEWFLTAVGDVSA